MRAAVLETSRATTPTGNAAVTRAGAGQLAQPLSCVLHGALVSGWGCLPPSSTPELSLQVGDPGVQLRLNFQPHSLADEFQRLCAPGLPLLPSYPGPFPSLPGFGSSGGVGPGPGLARHSPHGSNGRRVPSLGLGDGSIGEGLGGGVQDPSSGKGDPGLRVWTGLWSGGRGLSSGDGSADSGLGVGADWRSQPPRPSLSLG